MPMLFGSLTKSQMTKGQMKAAARRIGIPFAEYKEIAKTQRRCQGKRGKSERHFALKTNFRQLLSGTADVCEDCRNL